MKSDEYKTVSVYLHKDNIKNLDDYAKQNKIISRSTALNILLAQLFSAEDALNENNEK